MFRSHSRFVPLLSALVLCAGCANPFRSGYESRLERWPKGEVERLLPADAPAKLLTSTNMRRDAIRMMEEGYLLLGRSKFTGPAVNPGEARSLAKEVGASVVLVQQEFVESVAEAVPVSEWIPPREVTYTMRQEVDGEIVEREVTREVQGEFQTRYVPETTDYYEHRATYWAKSKPPIFGVLVHSMQDRDRQRIGSNRGVVVSAVINDSPAFDADILRGDVITAVSGTVMTSPDQFFDYVVANQGKEVQVELAREKERKTVTLTIRDE